MRRSASDEGCLLMNKVVFRLCAWGYGWWMRCIWSMIAGRLPGQTENEIKNYWNTNLSKKVQVQRSGSGGDNGKRSPYNKLELEEDNVRLHEVIRTKAVRCTRVLIPLLKSDYKNNQGIATVATVARETISLQSSLSCSSARPEESRGCLHPRSPDFLTEFNVNDLLLSYAENPEIHFHREQDHPHNLDSILNALEDGKVDTKGLEHWGTDELFASNRCFDFNILSSFLKEDNERVIQMRKIRYYHDY